MKFPSLNSYLFFAAAMILLLQGCSSKKQTIGIQGTTTTTRSQGGTMKPYTINGKTYYPTVVSAGNTFSGTASWYGKDFHGKKTSNGETYDMYKISAAHKTFPMNTIVKVTNTKNNKSVVVRINDRGPFVQNRIIDLSYKAALTVDMVNSGTAPVKLEVLGFEGVYAKDASAKQSVVIDDFDVQIGAFRKKSGAQIYEAAFNDKNRDYKAVIREGILDGDLIYRVWVRGFRGEEEARDFISRSEYEGAFIVREK
ncbi:MAG: septal ring lytic transglycosylase RlpA family protein [Campylobacteraceae bacterium]|nr:septal ring lytic transglycosylase RlpA family protein [Campylobacteraceae bacterium]